MAESIKEATSLTCVVLSPDRTLFEGEVERISVPGFYGELAILPNHTPFYSELVKGDVVVWQRGKEQKVSIEAGLIRARNNQVTIVIGFETD